MKIKGQRIKLTATYLIAGLCLLQSQDAFGQNQSERGTQNPPNFAELLTEMDTNKDGKLSKAEVKGPIQKDFDTIDSNNDGFIVKSEFESAPMRKRPGKKRID